MIYSLKGIVVSLKPFHLLLDCNGIGYGITIPLSVYDSLTKQNIKECKLYTRVIYREDSQTIYGFLKHSETDLFDFLRRLPGIGPKVALNLISTLGETTLIQALKNADAKMLTHAPRVGKAKAEKIIFEAKSRIKKINELYDSEILEISAGVEVITDLDTQIDEALMQLGFNPKEIDQARAKVSKLADLPKANIKNLQAFIKLYLTHL